MTQTWTLLPGEYVVGNRVVETTLRPVRVACLIPEDDPGMAARFAESRSLAWGGQASYALPFSRSEGLRQPWRALLDLLDPDRVYALGISRPHDNPQIVNAHASQATPPKPLVKRIEDGLGRMLYTAEEGPQRLFGGASTLLHSVLRTFGETLKPPDADHFLVIPNAYQGRSVPYLPTVARYGSVNDAAVNSYLNRIHSGRYTFALDLSKLVRIEEVSAADDLRSVLAGDLSGLLGDDAEHALTLPYLTRLGLHIDSRDPGCGVSRRPPGSREERRFRPIVVTGQENSVEDFALYWNLRAEHVIAEPFPVWIPIDLLEGEESPAAIERALRRVPPSPLEPPPRKDDLIIVSASMGATELRERLDGRFPEARISADDLLKLFTATCEYYYAREKLPAHFDRGRASIQPPQPEELKKEFISPVDHVAYEVRVRGMWVPQSEAVAQNVGWMHSSSRDYVTKNGNLRFTKQYIKNFSERDLLDLRTPDGWTLLRSVFEERGYDVAPTAKAAAALGQLALIGGADNLDVLASSKVRQLLEVLSRWRGEKRPWLGRHKTLDFEQFRQRWGSRRAAHDVLQWLVKKRVVFRGVELECPRCRVSGWYAIDRVGEVWRCDGCQEDSPIPVESDKTEWHYRINELYAHGHNQGTLTPLLTLHTMAAAWGGRPSGEDLGFYPGVEIKAKKGARVPYPKKEIDLVALHGRELVLAECKESTEHLAKPENAAKFAHQIAEAVVLANHLGASQLLVASSTLYPVEKETLLRESPTDHSVKVSWLDGRDLLDPYYFANPLAFEGASSGVDKPEGWDEEYLELLRKSLTDTSR